MIDFNIERFVRTYMTKRPESLLKADFEKYADRMHEALDGKKMLVIGGAGTIADPTRTAVALNKYVKEAPFQDPEQSPFMTSIHVLKDDPDFEV